MGEVIKYSTDTWRAMRFVQDSIKFYEEQTRDNDVYGTAKAKEKRILKTLMAERI